MKSVERLAVPFLFFLLAALSLAQSVYRPFHNWDMIMYIAAAKSFEEANVESLHTFTYTQLRGSVSEKEYEKLVQSGYRYKISTDPSAFKEQLPFYQIRPIYNGLIYLLYKAGVDIGFATHIISGVAVVIATFFLYLISVSFLEKPLIYTIPPLALVFGVLDFARYSTPDGLAFLAVIFASFLYLTKRTALLIITLTVMIAIRTNLILFTVPLLIVVFVFERRSRWVAGLAILISSAIYIAIVAYGENPGWSTLFYFTFVRLLTHPISMPPTLTAPRYALVFLEGTERLLSDKSFIVYVLVTASSLYLIKLRTKTMSIFTAFYSRPIILAFVCNVFIIVHFLAYPLTLDRFYAAPYLIGTFSLIVLITDFLKTSDVVQRGAPLAGDSTISVQ